MHSTIQELEQCETNNKLQTILKPTSTPTFAPSVGLGPIFILQSLTRLWIVIWKLNPDSH